MVDGGGLENRFPERGRGFESYSLRHAPRRVHGCPEPRRIQGKALNLTWFRAPENNMYYVYVLKSGLDGNLYVGYTADLRGRFQDHQNGRVPSTKPRRPLELVFYEGYKSLADAKRREKYFKTSKGKSSLQIMLRDSLK